MLARTVDATVLAMPLAPVMTEDWMSVAIETRVVGTTMAVAGCCGVGAGDTGVASAVGVGRGVGAGCSGCSGGRVSGDGFWPC